MFFAKIVLFLIPITFFQKNQIFFLAQNVKNFYEKLT